MRRHHPSAKRGDQLSRADSTCETSLSPTLAMAKAPPTLLQHTVRMITYGVWRRRSSISPSWRTHLSVPFSLYALSSFAYTAVGLQAVAMWMACPAAVPEYSAAIAIPEACLVALQGVWSFHSDVLHVGQDSIFHVVDRASAVTLVAVQLAKFAVFLPWSMTSAEVIGVWIGLVAGIFCKLRGYRAILRGSVESFRLWHILWHVSMPLTIGVLHSTRWRSATCTL